MRYQQTRFQREVAQATDRFSKWAANPWRRLSLQIIMLFLAFAIGGSLGSLTGALSYLDPVAAVLCVASIEVATRLRGRFIAQPGDRLGLQLLDMGRIGLLYGLLVDGFKLL